ncbi:MAG TPA: class I SAM-dependent methyltransferase [Candidatus Acidoferrales bacterium]
MSQSRRKRKAPRRSPSYEAIGQFYDSLWLDNPRAWTAARSRLLEPIVSGARRVCELGCGTGVTAMEFARRGLKVFALDYSREMCRVTREKALAEGLDVQVARGDMRTFRLPVKVDLVTSEWGVINHLRRKAELAQTFRAVARAVKPGGYFFFDLHQQKLYEEGWPKAVIGDGVTAEEGKKFFAAQHGGYDRKNGKGWTEITIFVRRAGGLWQRRGERIEEICWSQGEIVRDLKRAGFQLLRVCDFADICAAPSPKRGPDGMRTMYLARLKSR